MEQFDILQDDVKEYRPRKKVDRTSVRFMDNYNLSPDASSKLMKGEGLDDAVEELDSGVMMSTSEVIDFSEGTDSWTNQH
jgi:5,10-methenyltetrahydromethanopterin hydrogenase